MRLPGLLHKIIGKLLKAAVGGDTDIPMHRVSAAESLPDKLSSETASCWSCTLTMLQETSFGPRSLAKFKEACLPSPCPNGAPEQRHTAPPGLAQAGGAAWTGAGCGAQIPSHGLRDAREMPALPGTALNTGQVLYKAGPPRANWRVDGGERKLILSRF